MTNTNEIWSEFKDQLLGFIIKRVNDKTVAEDLLQEVFIKIHTNIEKLESKAKLTSWVYQITRNIIIDHYRKVRYEDPQSDIKDSLPEDDKEMTEEMVCCLKPFIENLPEKYADALIKTSIEGFSQKEYAERIGESYSATKSRVQRARKLLKAEFENCCEIEADKYGNVLSMEERNKGCKGC